MKELAIAKLGTSASDIVDAMIGQTSVEVRAAMGRMESFKRSIRRQRKQAVGKISPSSADAMLPELRKTDQPLGKAAVRLKAAVDLKADAQPNAAVLSPEKSPLITNILPVDIPTGFCKRSLCCNYLILCL